MSNLEQLFEEYGRVDYDIIQLELQLRYLQERKEQLFTQIRKLNDQSLDSEERSEHTAER